MPAPTAATLLAAARAAIPETFRRRPDAGEVLGATVAEERA